MVVQVVEVKKVAVRIRLKRMGAKKKPFYRIVVADSRFPRDGRFIEEIGYYNPTTKPSTFEVDREKAEMWLSRGARPSDTVRLIFEKAGVVN
jgi:small subunit ribosomal protein S16